MFTILQIYYGIGKTNYIRKLANCQYLKIISLLGKKCTHAVRL